MDSWNNFLWFNGIDFAIHTLAIDSELDETQKALRIQEVHQLCETYKTSELYQQTQEQAYTIPSICENQPILDEIDSIEYFEKHNIFYKFWKSMFGQTYPTSWWVQFKTLVSRSFTVMVRDPRLTIARFSQTIFLSVLIGLVFMQLGYSQAVCIFIHFHSLKTILTVSRVFQIEFQSSFSQ